MSNETWRALVLGTVLAALPALLVVACNDDDDVRPTSNAGNSTTAGEGGEPALGGNSGRGGLGGVPSAGSGGTDRDAREPCEITLETFVHNDYRSCWPTAPATDECDPVFRSGGREEVCENMHIYAWGYDGRIACAYSEATGELVGGFLWGLPVEGRSCDSYFAGPASLAACPVPTVPYCDGDAPPAGDAGGAAGAGGMVGAGAAGAGGGGQ